MRDRFCPTMGLATSMPPPVWPYVNRGRTLFFGTAPLLFPVVLAVLIAYPFLSRFTAVGRVATAINANELAAWPMGCNVRRGKMQALPGRHLSEPG